jgi:hypothetical protein
VTFNKSNQRRLFWGRRDIMEVSEVKDMDYSTKLGWKQRCSQEQNPI